MGLIISFVKQTWKFAFFGESIRNFVWVGFLRQLIKVWLGWFYLESIKNFGWVKNLGGLGCSIYNYFVDHI